MPQYLPLGQVNAPAQWTLPSGLDLAIGTVFASFDGTGAAGSYIPTLEIISDGGETVIEVPQDASVAAGSSVVASWAPFLKSQAAGVTPPPSTGGLPYAIVSLFGATFADTGLGLNFLDFDTSGFLTTDPTVFDVATGFGNHGIKALVPGEYFGWVTTRMQTNAAPPAGAMSRLSMFTTGGEEFTIGQPSGFYLIDATPVYESGATLGWHAVVNTSGAPAPQTFRARAGQNSGGAVNLEAFLEVVQITPSNLA